MSRFISTNILPFLFVFFFASATTFAQQDTTKQVDGTGQTDGAAQVGAAGGLSSDAAVIAKGLELFNGNCKQCHAVNEKVVGPALAKVYERRQLPWLINFIKYPQKTIESGDAYAAALYKEYKQFMPNHDFLKDDEIVSILSYVQEETKNPTKATTTGGGTTATAEESKESSSGLLVGIVIGLATLLVVVLAVLAMLGSVLTKYLAKEKVLSDADKAILNQRIEWGKILTSRGFVGIASFVFVALVLKVATEGLITIGVQQGYAPEQPIPFSHKLHAGQYEIDCKYCHNTVEKSKHASIPGPYVCMNCHNSIKTTSPNMQKIYEYVENDEPIQWVRVHNLPDLAYFNHAQHVKVAGLDCTNCHGDIKNMEVVQQVSLLTMGWCIDCHRKTEVNAKGNAYYDDLTEMHSKYSKQPMKVENIGGLECSKCHY
ncbi:MAG: cytochrome C [Cytophagales bacterium]|nr:MAG: cytochrome C [Cytophagales bacterium]